MGDASTTVIPHRRRWPWRSSHDSVMSQRNWGIRLGGSRPCASAAVIELVGVWRWYRELLSRSPPQPHYLQAGCLTPVWQIEYLQQRSQTREKDSALGPLERAAWHGGPWYPGLGSVQAVLRYARAAAMTSRADPSRIASAGETSSSSGFIPMNHALIVAGSSSCRSNVSTVSRSLTLLSEPYRIP